MVVFDNLFVRIPTVLIVFANTCTLSKKWNKTVELSPCKDLPSTCHYDSSRRNYEVENPKWTHKNTLFKYDWFICESGFDSVMAIKFERYLHACLENKPKSIDYVGIKFSITIRLPSRKYILNDSTFYVFFF